MNSSHINEKGFSIIEALIAAVILTSTVFLFTYFSSQSQRKVHSSLNNICQNIADSSLNKILALGYGSELTGVQFEQNQVNTSNLINKYLEPSDRITNAPVAVTGAPGNHRINSYQSIIGSMYLLDRLYNKSASVCNSTLGIEYPTLLENTDPSGRLVNIVTRIKINTKGLTSNTPGCQPTPFYTRPAGVNEGSLAGVFSGSNVHSDYGYHVLITTQYRDPTDSTNTLQSCSSTALFAYPKQRLVSEAQAWTVTITPGPLARCATTGPQTQLRLAPPAQFDTRLGLIPFCRDRSNATALPPGCPTGRVAETVTLPHNNYVPCNRVTLCGRAPTSSTTNPTTGVITNIYGTTPIGCNFIIDTHLVDEAMNTRVNPVTGLRNPAPTPECEPCPPSRPVGPGYCAPTGTAMNQCSPPPPPPPPSGGGGNGDGNDGGNDGRGGDGSDG